jgi:hypothetical protein
MLQIGIEIKTALIEYFLYCIITILDKNCSQIGSIDGIFNSARYFHIVLGGYFNAKQSLPLTTASS